MGGTVGKIFRTQGPVSSMTARMEFEFLCDLLSDCFSASANPARQAWLAQLVRSVPSDHKVPGSIPGFAEIRIFLQPSFPPKPTQLSILPG